MTGSPEQFGVAALQVTGDVRWDAPEGPTSVEMDDAGTRLLAEPEGSRVMPSRSTVLAGEHLFVDVSEIWNPACARQDSQCSWRIQGNTPINSRMRSCRPLGLHNKVEGSALRDPREKPCACMCAVAHLAHDL